MMTTMIVSNRSSNRYSQFPNEIIICHHCDRTKCILRYIVIHSFHGASPETELVIVQRVAILFAETRDRQQNGITNFENRI